MNTIKCLLVLVWLVGVSMNYLRAATLLKGAVNNDLNAGNWSNGVATVTILLNPSPIAGATYWAAGASGRSIMDSTNWSNGLPTTTKPGVLLTGDYATSSGRNDLYSKTFILYGNAKLSGGDRVGSTFAITLNDYSSWVDEKQINFGRNGPATLNVNDHASVNFSRLQFFDSPTMVINQNGGRISIGYMEDAFHYNSGTVLLRAGYLQIGRNGSAIAAANPITFTADSTGVYRTPTPNYGSSLNDYGYQSCVAKWQSGNISICGQYGAPFADIFNYTPGVGITPKSTQPFTSDGSRVVNIQDWVMGFDPKSVGTNYIKNLVNSGHVTWGLGNQGSAAGTGPVLNTWVNAQGVNLYMSSNELWAANLGSVPSGSYANYLTSYGVVGATSTPPVASELTLTNQAYPYWTTGAQPQGTVDKRSPWFQVAQFSRGLIFRLSQDPSFSTGVIQSEPLLSNFWNPWQALAPGTWYWTYGYTNGAEGVAWHTPNYSFVITGSEKNLPLPPTADQVLAMVKSQQNPFFYCNSNDVGKLFPSSLDPQNWRAVVSWMKSVYGTMPAMTLNSLNPSAYTSLSAFQSAINSAVSTRMHSLRDLTFCYLLLGRTFTNSGLYNLHDVALQGFQTLKQEYDTRRWTVNYSGTPQVVKLSDVTSGFKNYDWDIILVDAFGGEVDQSARDLFVNFALVSYLNAGNVRGTAYLTNSKNAPTYLFGKFENTFYDQHMQQLYIWIDCRYMLFFAKYLPDMEQWFKWSYNVYMFKMPSGSRDDGAWTDGNGYIGSSLWSLTDIPALYTRMTDYNCNFFKCKPWWSNFPKYLVMSAPRGNPGGGFSDSIGNADPGPDMQQLMECLWTFDKTNAYENWHLYKVFGTNTPTRFKMAQRFKDGQTTLVFTYMSLLSFIHHYGGNGFHGTGQEVPPAEKAGVFRDMGLACMMTDPVTPTNNLFVKFQSCPFGARYHAHPAQNAFNVAWGGKDLFWHTGFYNTAGAYHDREDYKASRGHNTIMPDGIMQMFNSESGCGWLPRFVNGERITYALGDGVRAYPQLGVDYDFGAAKVKELGYGFPQVTKFRRHIMMLRPSHVIVYDELEAKSPIPWTYTLHTRTCTNMTDHGNGFITAYNAISTAGTNITIDPILDDDDDVIGYTTNITAGTANVYGLGAFKLFCQEPFSTTVTDYFFGGQPVNHHGKYPDGFLTHHHAYLTTTGKHDKLRFFSVINVSKSGDSATVPAEPTGYKDTNGLFTVDLGDYRVKVQLDATKPSYIEARSSDGLAALVGGSAAQSITLNGVTHNAVLPGDTLLMERNTAQGDIFQEEKDVLPDAVFYGNRY